MRNRRTIGILALLLGLLVMPASGRGADEKSFLSSLKACQKAVRARRYSTALKQYRRLLEAHEGLDYVRRRAAAIEDDLKICHFHAAYREPKIRDLLGPAVVKFKRHRRTVVLSYVVNAAGSRDWEKDGSIYWLDHVFEGDLQITHSETTAVFFHYDRDGGTGYGVLYRKRQTAASPSEWTPVIEHLALMLYRYDGDTKTRLAHDQFDQSRYQSVERNHTGCDRKEVRANAYRAVPRTAARVYDHDEKTYRRGRIGIAGPSFTARIDGKLDKAYLAQLARKAEIAAYEKWCATAYDRDAVLPAWLREKTAARSRPLVLPGDAPSAREGEIRGLLRAWHDGEVEDFPKALAALERKGSLPPLTGGYLRALASLDAGEIKKALAGLTTLLEAEAGFGPAHALRGLVHLRLRDEKALALDLARAKELAPDDPLTVLLEVLSAQVAGDIEKADDTIAAATQRGVRTRIIDSLAHAIHRSRYGPAWTRRYRKETPRFTVESDLSHDASLDVANRLSSSRGAYAKLFPGLERAGAKARVRVFSNRKDYVAYGRELGSHFGNSAGVYIPRVRELVIFYRAGEKETFDRVVRHEGFHWYVHELVDDLPIWFDEGHAVFFESLTQPGKLSDPMRLNSIRVLELRALERKRKRFPVVTARALMHMDAEAFMKDTDAHYPHAWALVHMLRTTKNATLAPTLDAYFAAVRKGLSRAEAFEAVYAGCVELLEATYADHVAWIAEGVDREKR